MEILAPAKINLFLHVVGRRADGYHELQTMFQLLDWGDQLILKVRTDGRIKCVYDVPGAGLCDDLCLRAANALRIASNCELGVDIRLKKRIPIGGGLGGGSSDCASVLIALNHLWGLKYTTAKLADLAVRLGADVPMFVRGRSAWAEGIGEKLCPVELSTVWFLVVNPHCQVSTRSIFTHPALTRDTSRLKIGDYLRERGQTSPLEVIARTQNDCESVVRAEYRAVNDVFNNLEKFGTPRMTGTGSSVFVAFEDKQQALASQRRLSPKLCHFVARGLNFSPSLVGDLG